MKIEQYRQFVSAIKYELSIILSEKCYSEFIVYDDDASNKGQVFTFKIFYSTEYKEDGKDKYNYEPIVRPILDFQFKGKYKNETFDINQFFYINDLLFEEFDSLSRRGELDRLIPILKEANSIPEFKEVDGSFFICLESSVNGTIQFMSDLLEESILTIGLSEGNEIEFDCSQNQRETLTTSHLGGIPTVIKIPFDKKGLFIPDELKSIQDEIKLGIVEIEGRNEKMLAGFKTFIVHGQDEVTKYSVKNFLQNTIGLPEPIILHEQSNRGRTLIEKFEQVSNDSDTVFVLLTPDDRVAQPNESDDEKRRARQNVIFEMGYFLGKLGRSSGKVILLYKGQLELPSDISGIVYINIDHGVEQAGEYIRRELRELGVNC
jgi:hypothetical protein